MNDFVTREKEFRKLNAKLDQITTTALHSQQRQHPKPMVNNAATIPKAGTKTEAEFFTFTRKGHKTSLKKNTGAGDGNSDFVSTDNGSSGSPKEYPQYRHMPVREPIGNHYPNNRQRNMIPTKYITKHKFEHVTTTDTESDRTGSMSPRRRLRPFDNPTQPRSPTIKNREPVKFTIKYRNPNFVESPSLETMAIAETASIGQDNDYINKLPNNSKHTSLATTQTTSSISSNDKKKVTSDGLIKYLKSKIAILETDHQRVTRELHQQKELLEKTLERHKKVEQQRDQTISKNNTLSEQLGKIETQLDEANRRNKEFSVEQNATHKELESLKREVKVLTQTNASLERRLNRANEDLQSTRTTLKSHKGVERDLKETMRLEAEAKDKQIRSLKKQRSDLLNAYKKQLFLIDNLKRQNICIEQAKMAVFNEKEFTKVLEWNDKP